MIRFANQNTVPAFTKRGSSAPSSPPLSSQITSIRGLGDSIMVGQNCKTVGWSEPFGDWDDATDSFFNQLLAAFPAWTGNANQAERGYGVMLANVKSIADLTYGTNRKAYLVFAGYNDYRKHGNNAQMEGKIERHYRSMCSLHILKNWTHGSGYSAISGSYIANTYQVVGTRTKVQGSGYNLLINGLGSQVQYTFNGDGVVLGIAGSHTWDPAYAHTDTADIYVDDVLQEEWDTRDDEGIPAGYEILPDAHYRTYKGFGPGTHVIKIVITSARGGSGFYIDGIGETADLASDVSPFIAMTPLRQTAAGYVVNAGFDQGSDAAQAAASAKISSVITTFNGYYPGKFWLFDTDAVCDPNTDFDTDLIHPKRIGHDNLAAGLIALVSN